MRNFLVEKTRDVICSQNLLDNLGAGLLLYSRDYDLLEYLTSDIALLKRRSLIFGDTDRIDGLKSLKDETVITVSHIAQMVRMQNSFADNERGLYSVKQLKLYFEVIDKLSGFFEEHSQQFTSEDYKALFGDVLLIAQSDEYKKIKSGTTELIGRISGVKSISVGFNIDASMSPCESGILSVNDDYVKSGLLIDRILRMDDKNDSGLLSLAPLVPPKKLCNGAEFEALNFSLYAALNKIFKKQIRQWEPEINAYIAKNLGFLIDMLPDFKFISDIVGIMRKMRDAGLSLCLPEYYEKEKKVYRATNIYNPVLAINQSQTEQKRIIKNSLTFDEQGVIYLLSGPNNGGKTVFMCAVCGGAIRNIV